MLGGENTGLGSVNTAGGDDSAAEDSGADFVDIRALFRDDFDALFSDEGGLGLLSEDGYQPLLDAATYVLGGTSPYLRSQNYAGGVVVGPAGSGDAVLFNANGNPAHRAAGIADQAYVANLRIQPWAVGGLVAVASNPAPSTVVYGCGMSSGIDDEVRLAISGGISTTVFQLIVDGTASGTGSVTTPCNSVATLGAGLVVGPNNLRRFMIGFDPNSGLCKAGIDGVLAASVVPGTKMPLRPMSPYMAAATTGPAIPGIHVIQSIWWAYGL